MKTLLHQGISSLVFYGDMVYKFKRIVGKPTFHDQFKKIIKHYKIVGYSMDSMRQSACLLINPITVYSYGFVLSAYGRSGLRLNDETGINLQSVGKCLTFV